MAQLRAPQTGHPAGAAPHLPDDPRLSWAALARRLTVLAALGALAWTAALAGSLAFSLREELRDEEARVLTLARAVVGERLLTLRWAAAQRGLVRAGPPEAAAGTARPGAEAAPTGRPPSPSAVTPGALVAELTRLGNLTPGLEAHLVSPHPLDPGNRPDAWETRALAAFAEGEQEAFQAEERAGRPWLRYAQAVHLDEACVRCHAAQREAVGDLRGAVSIAVPMERAAGFSARHARLIILGHLALWVTGLAAILLARSTLARRLSRRERAELELRRAKERLDLAAQGGGVGFWDWHLGTGALHYDEQARRIIGQPERALAEVERGASLVHPEDLPALAREVERCRTGEAQAFESDHRFQGVDGRWIWVHSRGAVVEADAAGRAVRMAGTFVDITGRKAAEAERAASQEKLARILEVTSDGYFELDLHDGAAFLSPAWKLRLALAEAASVDDLLALVHRDDRPRVVKAFRESLGAGSPGLECEYRVLGADGEVRWFATRGKVVRRDDRGAAWIFAGTVSDVDARKRLEAQLVLADRLAALGTLAGGVAHELNGPLSYVGANLDHVIGALGDPAAPVPAGELLEALVDARDGVRTAASIIRDLRVLSRPNDRTAPLSPRAALEAAIGVARPVLAQRALLELSLGETPIVIGSHDRLVQVFVNLLLNAAQAVPDARLGASSVRIRTGVRAGGRETFVEIEDQGRGIPAERVSRLFDPFFSTRPPGKGAGMGLAISHSIVAGMGGSIEVESRLGHGSTFRVVLPVAVDPPPTA